MPSSLYVCGRYEGGMKDFHLSLMRDNSSDKKIVSFVRITRSCDISEVISEHERHGITEIHIMRNSSWWFRQLVKVLPIFALKAYWLKMKTKSSKMVITAEGFCFGLLPCFVTRNSEIFYHDPVPHVSSVTSFKVKFENYYKKIVHEKKVWSNLLVGSKVFVKPLSAKVNSPVLCIPFPRFSRQLFPEGQLISELKVEGYLLVYGRIDRYKGVYEWLVDISDSLDSLPPIVLAGRVVDERVFEFLPHIIIIDRFILNEEVSTIFEGAIAVVLPYKSVTHSGIGDISISFGKPTYLPSLEYFVNRYQNEKLFRQLANLKADFT